MVREISAGGIVLREMGAVWHVALIEPRRDESKRKQGRAQLSLPKGLVDAGEKPALTAVREVREETGIIGEVVTKLADIKYVYVRTWGDGERVFKIVSFYLLRYISGQINEIAPEMRIEVERALWVPLEDAGKKLAFGKERKVLEQARDYVKDHDLA